jgi:hypothetical protein
LLKRYSLPYRQAAIAEFRSLQAKREPGMTGRTGCYCRKIALIRAFAYRTRTWRSAE